MVKRHDAVAGTQVFNAAQAFRRANTRARGETRTALACDASIYCGNQPLAALVVLEAPLGVLVADELKAVAPQPLVPRAFD